MQVENLLGSHEITSYDWDELVHPENAPLLNALIACYIQVFDHESGFEGELHTPELVGELMVEQLGGQRNKGGRIWAVTVDWDDTKHVYRNGDKSTNGYIGVPKADGTRKAVIGVAWTPGKNKDESFLKDTVIRTSTLFKDEKEASLIKQNAQSAFDSISPQLLQGIAYASEMALRELYRGGSISMELLTLSGQYLLSLGMEQFILWTDETSPMFSIALNHLRMNNIQNLNNQDRHLLLGNLEESLAVLRRINQMMQKMAIKSRR